MLNGLPLMESGKRTTVSSTQSSTVNCLGSISSLCDLRKIRLRFSRIRFLEHNIAFNSSKVHTRNKLLPLLYSSISSCDMRLRSPSPERTAVFTHMPRDSEAKVATKGEEKSIVPACSQIHKLAGDPLVVRTSRDGRLASASRTRRGAAATTTDANARSEGGDARQGNESFARVLAAHDRSSSSRRRLLPVVSMRTRARQSSQIINKRTLIPSPLFCCSRDSSRCTSQHLSPTEHHSSQCNLCLFLRYLSPNHMAFTACRWPTSTVVNAMPKG